MGTQVLEEAGIENARADVEWLVASCLGTRRMQLYLDLSRDLEPSQRAQFESLLSRRAAREPLQHLLGTAEFFGRDFEVNRSVLIPRPETELLAALGVRHLRGRFEAGPGRREVLARTGRGMPLSALDFGTGSGCLAITLALEIGGKGRLQELDTNRGHEPGSAAILAAARPFLKAPEITLQQAGFRCCSGLEGRAPRGRFMERWPIMIKALDLSSDAIEVARRNARRHGCEEKVQFFHGDGFSALGPRGAPGMEGFDLILSNPPYVPTGEVVTLQPEVRDHDPAMALDGGEDGLAFYRRLASEASHWMNEGGVLMAEFGDGQFEAIGRLFRDSAWVVDEPVPDDTGRLRILIARPLAS